MKRDGLPEAGGGLNGKVVVVTGGTGYLGSSVCKAFAEAGATVVAVYLLDREIPYFEKVLGTLGKNVTLLKANVPEAGEMDRVTKEILTRLKRIDVLVNTVGGYMAGPVEETSSEDFDRAIALNLKSAFLACRAVVPSMRAAKGGAIVSVSSEAALQGDEESFLYSASKSGVNRLTESLARELKSGNVRVNCVMPRIMDTPSNREAMPKANFSKWVKTDQVARVIRWLCSDDVARRNTTIRSPSDWKAASTLSPVAEIRKNSEPYECENAATSSTAIVRSVSMSQLFTTTTTGISPEMAKTIRMKSATWARLSRWVASHTARIPTARAANVRPRPFNAPAPTVHKIRSRTVPSCKRTGRTISFFDTFAPSMSRYRSG